MGSLIFVPRNEFFIAVLEALTLRYVANAAEGTPPIWRTHSDIIPHSKDVLGLLIRQPGVITKVRLVHVEILRPQTKIPLSPPRPFKGVTYN
jgi:hypothetical protein